MAKPFDLNNIMEQAKVMQDRLTDLQTDVGGKEVEASAGGGMVKVTVSGKLELVSLKIEREVIDADDPEMLQDLVRAAVNEGIRKAQGLMNEEMSRLTGGLKIPGLG